MINFKNFIIYLIFFTICQKISYAQSLLDKRANAQWQFKEQDVLFLGQAVYDFSFKFDNQANYLKYLQSINVKEGSYNLVSKEIAQKIITTLVPMRQQAGGTGSNTAAGLAQLGARTTFSSVVGNDNIGNQYVNEIKKYGVGNLIKQINTSKGTGMIIIIISPEGNRTMLAYEGVSDQIPYEYLSNQTLNNYKMVFAEGYLWKDAQDNSKIITEFFRKAKNNGSITAFTFGDKSKVKIHRSEWIELLKEVDIIFSDMEQIHELLRIKNWKKIKLILKGYNTIFVITCGKDGAYIIYKDQEIYIPAQNIKNVIDTTGAGDQFAAGFLYGFLNNKTLKECGELGANSAAKIIQKIGAKP